MEGRKRRDRTEQRERQRGERGVCPPYRASQPTGQVYWEQCTPQHGTAAIENQCLLLCGHVC